MERGVPIRAVCRAISILQEINQMGSLSMMQISKRGRIPYPTACRIVQTLMHEGLIEQEPRASSTGLPRSSSRCRRAFRRTAS
ncbi:helix-turn-helix domain-containing protein [Novosphingobium resinovorum]